MIFKFFVPRKRWVQSARKAIELLVRTWYGYCCTSHQGAWYVWFMFQRIYMLVVHVSWHVRHMVLHAQCHTPEYIAGTIRMYFVFGSVSALRVSQGGTLSSRPP